MLQAIKTATSCEEVARRFAERVWSNNKNVLHFTYSGCGDGSSAYIYLDSDSWYCYSKRTGGDCIDLAEFILYGRVTRGKSDTFKQAINQLASFTEVSASSTYETAQDEAYVKDRNRKGLLEFVCRYSEQRMVNSDKAKILSRGLSEQTITDLRIGCLTREQGDDLLLKCDELYGAELVDQCGLTTGSGAERRLLLAGSTVVPIIYGGLVRSFVGYFGKGKYIRMRKSSELDYSYAPFGLDTINEPKRFTPVIVAEGIFDALSAYEAGFPCIATLGTAMSKQTTILLLDTVKGRSVKIVNDYDTNGTGWTAAIKLAKTLLQANVKTYVVKIGPELFLLDAPKKNLGLVSPTMQVSELALLYGMSERVMALKLSACGIEVIDGMVDDCQNAVSQLKAQNINPVRSLLADGILSSYLKTELPKPNVKIDLNDVWMMVGQEKDAMILLSERAIPALQAIIETDIDKVGMTRNEYINAVTNVISQYTLPKEDVLAALYGMGMNKADVEAATRRDSNVHPIVRYATGYMNLVDTVKTEDGPFMVYDENYGIWTIKGEDYHNMILRKHVVPPQETVAEVWKKVAQEVQANSFTQCDPFSNNSRYIVLSNGVYDTASRAFMPEFSKKFYATSRIPIVYDPKAQAPMFLKFLRELFIRPEDEGVPEFEAECANKIKYICELIGLLMVPDNSFQVFWTFLGEGGNGKTTLQNLIFALLSSKNISTVSLSQLGARFSTVNLVNKLVNITSEKEASPSQDTVEILKRIVGSEPIMVESKYMPPYNTIITSRFIISANKPIRWPIDGAMARRQRNAMLTFPCFFTDETEKPEGYKRPIDRSIFEKVIKEAPGILNLAIAGLIELRDRKTLLDLTFENEVLQDVREENPIFTFLFAHLKHSDVGFPVKVKNIYDVFTKWWHEQKEAGTIPEAGQVPKHHGPFQSALRDYVDRHMKGSRLTKGTTIGRPEVITYAVLIGMEG